MKIVFLFVCFAVAVVQGEDPHNLKEIHEKCQSDPELRLDQSFLEEVIKNPDTTNFPPNFSKHMHCLASRLNLINEQGEIDLEGVKGHIRHDVKDNGKVEVILKECAVDQGSTTETINHLWTCLKKNDILRHANLHYHDDEQ